MYKVKSFDEIFASMQENARAEFGENFNVSNTSNWARIFAIPTSLMLTEFSQKLKDLEDKMSIFNCSGTDLDDLLGNFLFQRLQATKSTGTWTTTNSVPNSVIAIGELTLERSVDGITYKNTNEVIINSLGVGEFNIECETFGSIGNGAIGEIDKVKVSAPGIVSGSNTSAISDGQDKETDLEYLNRWIESNNIDSYWNLDGIYAEILKVDGVKSAFVSCNRTNIVDVNGWLPHSRIYVVDGGNDEDIAKAIYKKTDRAIEENGNVIVNVLDIQNVEREVRFYRPTEQIIDFRFTLIGQYNVTSIANVIKQYIGSVSIGGLITRTNALESVRQAGLLTGVQSLEIDFSLGGTSQWFGVIQLEYNKKPIGNVVS